jgi:hypothetical protein
LQGSQQQKVTSFCHPPLKGYYGSHSDDDWWVIKPGHGENIKIPKYGAPFAKDGALIQYAPPRGPTCTWSRMHALV